MFKLRKKNKVDNESMQNGVRMVAVGKSKDINTEKFNTIRTNIQFSSVDKKYTSLLITSSIMSEGKSTVSANIAGSYAKSGKRVLLVDVDLRRPTLQSTFQVSSLTGLTKYLSDKSIGLDNIIFKTTLSNLYIIPSGPIPPNPSELLQSKRMYKLMLDLAANFDLVIYDAPPVLDVADAQILCNKVDGTILTIRQNYTDKALVKKATDSLRKVQGNIIGAVLNDIKEIDSNGYYGYGYYK